MATHGDKIDDLMKLAATLDERLNNNREELQRLLPQISQVNTTVVELSTKIVAIEQQSGDLRSCRDDIAELRKDIALIQAEVKILKDAAEKSLTRWWGFWLGLGVAVLGGVITAALTQLFTKK